MAGILAILPGETFEKFRFRAPDFDPADGYYL